MVKEKKNKQNSLEKNIQITKCPHRIFEFEEDLLYIPASAGNKGEYKCKLQQYMDVIDQYGSFNIEYKSCNYEDFTQCAKYNSKKE